MKKQIAIAMGLAVLSTGALASKARLEALGQGANGSMWLDDARNVVLNPAMLNFHKDFITMEWGKTNNGATADQDSAAAPKAEGGMFKAAGNMVYGLYFGEESNTSNYLRTISGTVEESNNKTFYVAGDAGVQWGVKLLHHDYKKDSTDTKSSAMRTTIGIISGDIEGYANIGLGNTAEVGAAEFKGNSSYDIAVTYGMGDVDYMLQLESINAENAAGDEFKAQNTALGMAKTYKLNDKATAWASAWYNMDSGTDDITGAGDTKSTSLPVTIALEVSAKDWLALRGSVTSNIIGEEEADNGDKNTIEDSTVVAAGASLLFGDLTIDGMIGNNSDTTAVAAGDTSGGNGTLRSDTLMSRVSMTYKF